MLGLKETDSLFDIWMGGLIEEKANETPNKSEDSELVKRINQLESDIDQLKEQVQKLNEQLNYAQVRAVKKINI